MLPPPPRPPPPACGRVLRRVPSPRHRAPKKHFNSIRTSTASTGKLSSAHTAKQGRAATRGTSGTRGCWPIYKILYPALAKAGGLRGGVAGGSAGSGGAERGRVDARCRFVFDAAVSMRYAYGPARTRPGLVPFTCCSPSLTRSSLHGARDTKCKWIHIPWLMGIVCLLLDSFLTLSFFFLSIFFPFFPFFGVLFPDPPQGATTFRTGPVGSIRMGERGPFGEARRKALHGP